MFSTERFRVWFQRFSHEHHRLRAARIKAELKARRAAEPEEYLSAKPVRLPRPRFHVRLSDSCPTLEPKPPKRRHDATKKKPTGRPANEGDVYLAPKVLEIMWDEWVTETEAILRVTDTLGQFDGWNAREDTIERENYRVRRKNARERVYRSLKRYREQIRADKKPVYFANANELARCALAPAEAGRPAAKRMLATYWV